MSNIDNTPSRRSILKVMGVGSLSLASMASLASCSMGVKSATSSGPVNGPRTGKELVVYMNAGHVYKAYTDVFDRFEKEHNIKVTVSALQWPDMQSKLTANFLSGDVPDLCEENGGWWSTRWGANGSIMPLDDYITKDGEAMGFPNDFAEAAVNVRQVDGRSYAIPLHLTCNGLVFYNKSMLSAAGLEVPQTWDQFTNAAMELTQGGVYGAALNQDRSYATPWLLQSGASYFDPASKEFMTPDDAALRTFQLQQDMVYKYKTSPAPVSSSDYSGPQKLFSTSKSAMMISGPWDISPIRQGNFTDGLGVGMPLTDKAQVTTLAGAGLMIPSRSQNADLAWELIKQLTALKTELAATAEVGMSMPRKSWAADPQVQNDELLSVVAQALPTAVSADAPLANVAKIANIDSAYSTFYQQVVSQNKPVPEAMSVFRDTVKSYL